jgi:hypothetical protein
MSRKLFEKFETVTTDVDEMLTTFAAVHGDKGSAAVLVLLDVLQIVRMSHHFIEHDETASAVAEAAQMLGKNLFINVCEAFALSDEQVSAAYELAFRILEKIKNVN